MSLTSGKLDLAFAVPSWAAIVSGAADPEMARLRLDAKSFLALACRVELALPLAFWVKGRAENCLRKADLAAWFWVRIKHWRQVKSSLDSRGDKLRSKGTEGPKDAMMGG